jgi:hypothetical protein
LIKELVVSTEASPLAYLGVNSARRSGDTFAGVAQAFDDLANPERHTKMLVEPWR